ncbi:hypothetical protein [Algibacter sp. PT7-4]|uniref:hypothetical protein n=1 Tax=Algibacter ulvanivorans TaxID=3400999 RepID=UPI003AAC0C66
MAFTETINIGTTPGDKTGDGVRTVLKQIHDNTVYNKNNPPEAAPGLSAYQIAVNNGYVGTEAQWIESLNPSSITSNEDIEKQDTKLLIANRTSNLGGKKGYKIIRTGFDWENIPITHSNSIWEIRDDFDLQGATITLPLNVILNFAGGIIKNGTINFNNTFIPTSVYQIFDNVTKGTGDFTFEKAYVENFGAQGDGTTDDGSAFQYGINFLGSNKTLHITSKIYLVNTPITINHIFQLVGENTKVNTTGSVIKTTINTGTLITSNYPLTQLKGITFVGSSNARGEDVAVTCLKTTGNLLGNNCDTQIYNCVFMKFYKAIEAEGRNVEIESCIFSTLAYALYIGATEISDIRGLTIQNCRFHSCGGPTSTTSVIYINPASNFSEVLINGYIDDCGIFFKGFSSETMLINMNVTKLRQQFADIDATNHSQIFNRRTFQIKNNNIHTYDPVNETNLSLIKLTGSFNANISNNMISRAGGHAIENNVTHARISGNTILNPGLNEDDTYYGIKINAVATFCFLDGNYIKQDTVATENPNSAKAAISLDAGGCMLKGNFTQGFANTEIEVASGVSYFGEGVETANRVSYASAMPTSGKWTQGDIVYNTQPTKDGNGNTLLGWFRLSTGSATGSAFWSNMYVSDVSI